MNRSPISPSLDALRYPGGVSSLDNFAHPWTRAAVYYEITPGPAHGSFLSANFRDGERPGSSAIDDGLYEDSEVAQYLATNAARLYPLISQYGSIETRFPVGRLNETAKRHATYIPTQKQASTPVISVDITKESGPLLVETVTTVEGTVENIIVGQSTTPQTVFNSVNVLIGIDLLRLPLGIRYSG